MERLVVRQLRELLQEVPEKGVIPLESALIGLFGNLTQAVRQCSQQEGEYYRANQAAYQEALGAVERMSEAIERDDLDAVRSGFGQFEAAIGRLDQLLQTHKD